MVITGNSKTVDIVIPIHVKDEPSLDYVRQCLNSIIEFTPKEFYNIICVIDRGIDATEEFLGKYLAKDYIHSILRNTSQRGFTRTCNIGLEESEADFALLLNMDTVVSSGWLEGLVDCARRTNAAVLGCKLVDEYGKINHAGAYGVGYHKGMNEINTGQYNFEEEAEWVTGACMLISKKVRDVLGNLNPGYPHWGSDREYCLEASKRGFKIMYSPITILHYTEKSKSTESDEYFKNLPR